MYSHFCSVIVVLTAMLRADAGDMMPLCLFVKYLAMTSVVSLGCDFVCMILLIRALMGQKMEFIDSL